MTDMELYQEEQRQMLIDLNKGIQGLSNLVEKQIEIYKAPYDSVKVSGEVQVNTQESVEVQNLEELKEYTDELGSVIKQAIQDNSYKPIDNVTVKNLKDIQIPDTVKINNLEDLKEYFATLAKAIKDNQPIVRVEKQELVLPTDPRKAIAVRLSDGKSFYTALSAAVGGGSSPTVDTGDGVLAVPVANPDGTPLSLGLSSVDTATSAGVTVADTSTTVLAVNANRKSATIVNDSDETIYLKLGSGASLNSGIRINANGGSAKITEYTGIITAISTSGGKVVTVTEL